MKKVSFLFVLIVLFTTLGFAQQVVVQTPNGEGGWKKGEVIEINWICMGCSGTAEVRLVRDYSSSRLGRPPAGPELSKIATFQDIGKIATVPTDPATQRYKVTWKVGDYMGGNAPVGEGYRILVKAINPGGTVSASSPSAFWVGGVPQISSFAIDNGASVTGQRLVTLDYKVSGAPAPTTYQMKCSPTPGSLTEWRAIPPAPHRYQLPEVFGEYTIELRVQNMYGTSQVASDSIRYYAEKDFTFIIDKLGMCGPTAGVFSDVNPGWNLIRIATWSGRDPTGGDSETCAIGGGVIIRTAPAPHIPDLLIGSKIEHEFFSGRLLNEGWSFVSLTYSSAGCKLPHTGYAILVMPQVGSRDIRFRARVWDEGGQYGRCELIIQSMTIRGPADKQPVDAFR